MADQTDNLWAIVLAAGSASRFGRQKLLENFRGEPLVCRALRVAGHVAPGRVVVVTGYDKEAILTSAAGLYDEAVFNASSANGIGSSLAAGVRHCATRAKAVLLLLADQPLVKRDYLDRLVRRWITGHADIVISRYGNSIGPPAIFSETTYASLAELKYDEGARAIVNSGDYVVQCMNEQIDNPDIDILEDLLRYS